MSAESGLPETEPLVRVDNDTVRVTEWRFAPGAETGWHRHEFDYVVVPLTDGRVRVVGAEGETPLTMRAGEAYFRRAGVEHNVINEPEGELRFVEIELKATRAPER